MEDIMTAKNYIECNGCKHQLGDSKYFWYFCCMFKDSPNKLPCGQHDMFKKEREETGRIIRKNPLILMEMICKKGHN